MGSAIYSMIHTRKGKDAQVPCKYYALNIELIGILCPIIRYQSLLHNTNTYQSSTPPQSLKILLLVV